MAGLIFGELKFKDCNKILLISAYNMTDGKMEIFNSIEE